MIWAESRSRSDLMDWQRKDDWGGGYSVRSRWSLLWFRGTQDLNSGGF